VKTIFREVWQIGQKMGLTEVVGRGSLRLRIRVVSDSYVDQCINVVECWDGDQWRELHTRHVLVPRGLAYGKDRGPVVKARDTLLEEALAILA